MHGQLPTKYHVCTYGLIEVHRLQLTPHCRDCCPFFGGWSRLQTRRCAYCCLAWTMQARPRCWNNWQRKTSATSPLHKYQRGVQITLWFAILKKGWKNIRDLCCLSSGLQRKDGPVRWFQVERLGHWRSAQDPSLLEELLWEHRCTGKFSWPEQP